METAVVSKGVALFATLIGIYNWIGQGTSFLDIIVLVFAAALILRLDFSKEKKSDVETSPGETQTKQSFFSNLMYPLRQFCLTLHQHVFLKTSNLTPFYLFSFN